MEERVLLEVIRSDDVHKFKSVLHNIDFEKHMISGKNLRQMCSLVDSTDNSSHTIKQDSHGNTEQSSSPYDTHSLYLTQVCSLMNSPGCLAYSIKRGSPVNTEPRSGYYDIPPLSCASISGSVECAALLVEHGADVNYEPPESYGPMLNKFALSGVFNPGAYDGRGAFFSDKVYEKSDGEGEKKVKRYRETALMLAIRYSTKDHVEMLLKCGAKPCDIVYAARWSKDPTILPFFVKEGDKVKALDAATVFGRVENVKYMLEQNALPDDITILTACSYDYDDIVAILIKANGGKIPEKAMETCIYWTSLRSLQVLLDNGVKVTPDDVYYACLNNRPKSLERILKEDVDITQISNNTFPLLAACRSGGLECVRILLSKSSNVNMSDFLGCTPLHWAALSTTRQNANIFNPKIKNRDFRSKFKESVCNDILDEILKYNPHINYTDESKFEPCVVQPDPEFTPLHVAIQSSNIEGTRLLLKSGSSQARYWDGSYPLHLAVRQCDDMSNGNLEIVKELIANDGDFSVVNADKKNPFDYALLLHKQNCAKLIRDNGYEDQDFGKIHFTNESAFESELRESKREKKKRKNKEKREKEKLEKEKLKEENKASDFDKKDDDFTSDFSTDNQNMDSSLFDDQSYDFTSLSIGDTDVSNMNGFDDLTDFGNDGTTSLSGFDDF